MATEVVKVNADSGGQRDSALVQWYRARTGSPKGARKTTMIVALARKLLIGRAYGRKGVALRMLRDYDGAVLAQGDP